MCTGSLPIRLPYFSQHLAISIVHRSSDGDRPWTRTGEKRFPGHCGLDVRPVMGVALALIGHPIASTPYGWMADRVDLYSPLPASGAGRPSVRVCRAPRE